MVNEIRKIQKALTERDLLGIFAAEFIKQNKYERD